MSITRKLTNHLSTQIQETWPEGPRRLVVGVSGGADSVCLIHLLSSVSGKMGFALSVVHVHHGIRGLQADADAGFVRDLCGTLAVPFLEIRVDAPALAEQEGLSLEDAARRLRHSVLCATAEQLEADAVALAHHRDDQAETILLNLLRGAANEGLCGMRTLRNGLFRPFLSTPASDLRDCLVENGWAWREDETNLDVGYRRNALRHRWIPMLREQLGQDPTGPLVRFAAIQREEQDFLSGLAVGAARDAGLQDDGFRHSVVTAMPVVLARRVVFLAWELAHGSRSDLETVHAEGILNLCRMGRPNSRLSLPGRMEATIEGEWCRLRTETEPLTVPVWQRRLVWPDEQNPMVRLPIPEAGGVLSLEAVSLETALWKYGPALRGAEAGNSQLIDSSRATAGIYLRNRRHGDVIRPWNAPGARTLKEWFIDRKIPAKNRSQLPLLAEGNRILWVIGYRTANELCASGEENGLFELTWEPDAPETSAKEPDAPDASMKKRCAGTLREGAGQRMRMKGQTPGEPCNWTGFNRNRC